MTLFVCRSNIFLSLTLTLPLALPTLPLTTPHSQHPIHPPSTLTFPPSHITLLNLLLPPSPHPHHTLTFPPSHITLLNLLLPQSPHPHLPILQVASGVSHLHEHNIVYYDLKSPNILVFQFPTPQESLQVRTLGRSNGNLQVCRGGASHGRSLQV